MEDGVLLLEQLESVLLDDDDHVEMPPPSIVMVAIYRIPATTLGASSSLPSRSSTSARFRPSQEAPLPTQGGPRSNRGGGRRLG